MFESTDTPQRPRLGHRLGRHVGRHIGRHIGRHLGRRVTSRRPGFTLTELLISLAIVSLLLIGISRIFALTSQTIGTGQALSKAVRIQRAISQALSSDFLGVGADLSKPDYDSGVMPFNSKTTDKNDAMPFLTISNFRVPTYVSAAAQAGDVIGPQDTATMPAATWASRSNAIRGIDLNNDGVENPAAVINDGETLSLYTYGERNFRVDTFSFFSRGLFKAQTGTLTAVDSELSSNEAYIWYGHARVFNSNPTAFDRAAGFGNPGEWLTGGPLPNVNNRYADQFTLARMQFVLSEPVDHDQRSGSYTTTLANGGEDRDLAEENAVVASNDPSKPIVFLQRKWWQPDAHYIDPAGGVSRTRPLLSPFTINDPVVVFEAETPGNPLGRCKTLYTSEKTSVQPPVNGLSDTNYQALFGRTDVMGVGLKQARARTRFVQDYDRFSDANPTVVAPPTTVAQEWNANLYTSSGRRIWVNPFVAANRFDATSNNRINAKSLSQRQQLLADGVSQMIVEFAGDFLTQNTTGTAAQIGLVTNTIPDGVLDFVYNPTTGQRVTRWYGLPRDVDGDGHIYGNLRPEIRTSTDVVPVRDLVDLNDLDVAHPVPARRTAVGASYPFEKSFPVRANDYATVIAEPATATSPDASGYVCVWGAAEFEGLNVENPQAPGTFVTVQYIPQMIRIIVDVRDPDSKLQEPVTETYVFPFRMQ
jgi:prepilin-type N-terminal cleavage/methylation domain-containing protein